MNTAVKQQDILPLKTPSGGTVETFIFICNSYGAHYKNLNAFQRLKASILSKSHTLSGYWQKMEQKTPTKQPTYNEAGILCSDNLVKGERITGKTYYM